METCCPSSPVSYFPPLPRPPPPRIPGWMLLVCSDSQRPQGDGVSFPVRAVGLHWGSDLNDWASKARNQARRGAQEPGRFAHPSPSPPERSHRGAPFPDLLCTEIALSLTLGGDTTWSDHPAVDSRGLVCS